MVVSTAHSGNWYSIEGTTDEVRAELNRVNAKTQKVVFGGNNAGTITLFVGSM